MTDKTSYHACAATQIQFNMCVMAILLSRELVKMDSLMCKLTPVLAGQYWLWDNNTASWIRPDDLAVVADEAHLVEFYRCIFKVPVISLFEAYNLNYVSDKKQPAGRICCLQPSNTEWKQAHDIATCTDVTVCAG